MLIQISLEQMRFYAYHGVLEQERRVGNHFEVSLTVEASVAQSLSSDALEDTINYALLHQVVAEEMAVPSELLEHVVGRMARRLFDEFAMIEGLDLRLSKCNPPFGGDVQRATVRLQCARGELAST